jgi:hypothetical protein
MIAKLFPRLLLLPGLIACCAGNLASAQSKAQMQVQMQQQVRIVSQQAMKVDVRALAQGRKVGEKVLIQVSLLNADNQPVGASQDYRMEVELIGPSGKPTTQDVEIKSGQSSSQFEFDTREAGLTAIRVHPADSSLLGGSSSLLVAPVARISRAAKKTKRRANVPAATVAKPAAWSRPRAAAKNSLLGSNGLPGGRLQVVGLNLSLGQQNSSPAAPATFPSDTPRLMLEVGGGKTEFLADGKDAAKITAFFMDPNGAPAPSDILVWMRWSNGEFVQNPLKILKNSYSGEAQLTSGSPVQAEVSFVASSPHYEVGGPTTFTVRFAPPIYGVILLGAEKMSLVDSQPVFVRFFDHQGNPISTDRKRRVMLYTDNAKIHLRPDILDVDAGSSGDRSLILPTSLGAAVIKASTDGYKPFELKMRVTGWFVIFLCIVGGILGGICAFGKLQGSKLWRVFTGVVAGAVLTWAYVYGALPLVDSAIVHNTVSVLFVSLIGGYLGTQVIDVVAKKFGFLPAG